MDKGKQMRICNLKPGDVVTYGDETAIYICGLPVHPLFPNVSLVVWQLSDGCYSFDALSPLMVIPGEYQGNDLAHLRRAMGIHD